MVGARLVWICFGSTLHPVCWLAANKGLGDRDPQTCVKMFHVILVVAIESCVGYRSNISPLRLLCSTPFSFFFWALASKHRSFTPSLHPLNIRFSKAGGGSSIFLTFTSKAPHCATPKRTLEFSQLRRLASRKWGACSMLFSHFIGVFHMNNYLQWAWGIPGPLTVGQVKVFFFGQKPQIWEQIISLLVGGGYPQAMRLWYDLKKKHQQKLLSCQVAFWMEALGTPTLYLVGV